MPLNGLLNTLTLGRRGRKGRFPGVNQVLWVSGNRRVPSFTLLCVEDIEGCLCLSEVRVDIEGCMERLSGPDSIPFRQVCASDRHLDVHRKFRRSVEQRTQFDDSCVHFTDLDPCRRPVVPGKSQSRVHLDGAVELAGVGAAALVELAHELALKVGDLGEEADEGGVDGGRCAVTAEAGAAVGAEANAAKVLGVAGGTGHGVKHGDSFIGYAYRVGTPQGRGMLRGGTLWSLVRAVL